MLHRYTPHRNYSHQKNTYFKFWFNVHDYFYLVPESNHFWQISLCKDPLEVVLRLLLIVGWEELHETVLSARFFDNGSDGGTPFLGLERTQQLQQKLERGAVLDLMLLQNKTHSCYHYSCALPTAHI